MKLKNRILSWKLLLISVLLAVLGLIAYCLALADAGKSANDLIVLVVVSLLAGVAIAVLTLFVPNLSPLKSLVPIAYNLSFLGIAYSVVFYVVTVSAKLNAYLSPAKVAALVLLLLAVILSFIASFMRDSDKAQHGPQG